MTYLARQILGNYILDYPMTEFALEQTVKIEGDATFARNRTLRMQLRRWWTERPKRWAAWLMTNPSDAGASRNDPTMLRVIHFTRSWGYDGCIAANLYPFIASNPKDMWAWRRWEDNGPDWYARDDLNSQHFGNRGNRTAVLSSRGGLWSRAAGKGFQLGPGMP